MSRRDMEDDAESSTQSIHSTGWDSVDERLTLAVVNAGLNSIPSGIPETNFTHPRDFLIRRSDEDLPQTPNTGFKPASELLNESATLSSSEPQTQSPPSGQTGPASSSSSSAQRILSSLPHTPRAVTSSSGADTPASAAVETTPSTPLEETNTSRPIPSLSLDEMDRRLRDSKPRLLLMGQRRSGKSSITNVVFHKTPPQETLFLESTTQIQKETMHSFMDFQIWDFPGQIDYFDPTFDTNQIFSEIGALVWVIDAQDDYSDSLTRLTTTILNLQAQFPHVNVEVFVHKIDSLNDEFRQEVRQDIDQRVGDELSDAGYVNPTITYHMTSIYDYSIFEAFSRVVQKLIPHHGTLENLMNTLVDNSGMAKAYLFDILTKVYVASDTRPVDMEVYELCADFIDVTVDITDLYGHERTHGVVLGEQMEETESSIVLHDGSMVYLKEMNRYLCLVTVIKNEDAKDKKGLIDYNVHCFQDALNKVLGQAWRDEATEGEGQAGEGAAQAGQQGQAGN